ncbi:MAG: hypothetical protein JW726_19935 [Anaerolineales bacterium]|nr:hypothetical protein [Anaerolineales bacterium]
MHQFQTYILRLLITDEASDPSAELHGSLQPIADRNLGYLCTALPYINASNRVCRKLAASTQL